MKNKLKLFGIMALVAVIGLSMVACSDDDDSIVGTWTGSYYYLPDEADTGFNVTITFAFKSDGTGTITQSVPDFPNESSSFKWSQSGSTITYTIGDNEPIQFTFNGGNSFTISDDDINIKFTRK